MLDINFIRENKELVRKGITAKQVDPKLVDIVLEKHDEWSKVLQSYEELRQKRNEIAHGGKPSEEGRIIKDKLQEVELEVHRKYEEYQDVLCQIPNIPAKDVKVGKDESENEILKDRKFGEPKEFKFKIRDHVELGELLNIIDIPNAVKVSGARFTYLKNEAVLLEFALVQLGLEILIKEGFTPIIPPALIKKEITEGLGYWERGGHEDYYWVNEPKENQGLYLVGTAEHSIAPIYKDETLEESDLPKRFVAFSSCFRREAGSYGKDTRGIFRVHQFDKVEMISFTKPEDSDKEHEFLLSLEEKLFRALEIPYQVVKMCTGDLGVPTARKYDIEAWMPSQGAYREVTSTSTTTDYQARRLKIKYGSKLGKSFVLGKSKLGSEFVHILNGTAFAIGRTIIGILENFQQEDGSVKIPEVLQKYTGFSEIHPK